jgi:NDP-mannose synthase
MAQPRPEDINVVILAGGKGTRLRPFTAVFPKPLVPLGEKPILEILLRRLAAFKLTNITLCTGHLSELIMAVFGDGSRLGVKLNYVREESPLGTAGPLGLLGPLSDPFMIMNGDLLSTLHFGHMLDFHSSQGAQATVSLYRREVNIGFGVIESDSSGNFAKYLEKPSFHFDVSMGFNILSNSVLRHIAPGQPIDMPELITRVHAGGGKVCCFREDCFWLDIGRVDDYALAQEQFLQNEAKFLGCQP